MTALRALSLALVGLFLALPAARADGGDVIIQALDKITARVSTLHVKPGVPVRFGTLTITVRSCFHSPPEEPPQSAAFLEIVENRSEEEPVIRFTGWMFSANPALSALEHPIYDLIVLDCPDGTTRSFQNSPDSTGN
ncbi:MAG TPA: DUF2155 domain-containing protein [Dongiaceae bacterium]|jgi:hypothetical protein|nr:DUF2155 domain-containing protein [Dongiaceae bacterium]